MCFVVDVEFFNVNFDLFLLRHCKITYFDQSLKMREERLQGNNIDKIDIFMFRIILQLNEKKGRNWENTSP